MWLIDVLPWWSVLGIAAGTFLLAAGFANLIARRVAHWWRRRRTGHAMKMSSVASLWAAVQGDPKFMTRLHGWLTLIWFVAAFPIMLFLSESVAFLVFVSVYAVVTGHWSSYQASRIEVKQDEVKQDLVDSEPPSEASERRR